MHEPPSSRLPRARPIARAAGLCAAAMALSSALLGVQPARALGEDGPFPFPVETSTVNTVPGAVTRIPLVALIEDDLQEEVDLGSARLVHPEDVDAGPAGGDGPPAESLPMALRDDGRTLEVADEGTWALIGDELIFTPSGSADPVSPIGLSIEGDGGSRSLPVLITPRPLALEQIEDHGSAGESATIELGLEVPAGGEAQLVLAGLPSGSTVVSDGSRVTVPDQGVWELAPDGSAVTFTPSGPGLGRQLNPVRYAVEDEEGAVQSAGRVMLTVPIISDLAWSAPFGEEILFVVQEGQQYVDPTTLRLEPFGDATTYDASTDGTRVVVDGQGTWVLDRSAATVRFTPDSDEVRETAPMGITGGDGDGDSASTALLSTAYPVLRSREQAGAPGAPISIDLSTGIRDVSTDSLRFDPSAAPAGAELSADDTEMRVPGEGTWRIDFDAGTVVMTPEEGFVGRASPVRVTARGVYADNPVSASLQVVFAAVTATPRDDEARTAPQVPVTADVLGNDTAGNGAQPLVPESVELSSLAATNLAQLENGRGRRLLIPGEGVFEVGDNGAVTFTPQKGFTGRTTAITYHVRDSAGLPAQATLVVDVDPDLTAAAQQGPEVSGINSLLVGLLPSAPGTSMVFGTIVLFLLFGGSVSLWIGLRMETDRRTWED